MDEKDDRDPTLEAMIDWVTHRSPGLADQKDLELLSLLLGPARQHGRRVKDLVRYRHDDCEVLGFNSDPEHHCGLTLIGQGYYGLAVQATGAFNGRWLFCLGLDHQVESSHDGQVCASFGGIGGKALAIAVVTSALTGSGAEPRPRRPRQRRRVRHSPCDRP